jgi:hypothetical protein
MSARSRWFTIKDRDAFLREVKPGDMLEFRRNGYQHWAVYVGRPSNFRRHYSGGNLVEGVEYVVHRANPGDSDFTNFSMRGASFAKGRNGIGNVVVEPLDDIWCYHCWENNVRTQNEVFPSFHKTRRS